VDKPHAKDVPGGGTIEHILHEVPADGVVLHGRRDRNRTKTRNRGTFVEEVTTDDLPIQFRHNCIHLGMRQPVDHAGYRGLR
jgi:hypothetical protein